jgi:hypothetical protein
MNHLSGEDDVVNYLKSLTKITFSSGAAGSSQQAAKRGKHGDDSLLSSDDAVLIGSRALSLYNSSIAVSVPTPAYARQWAVPQSETRDFDVVASVPRIVAAIEAASRSGALVDVTANVELRRVVVVVRVVGFDELVRLDLEPIVSRAAYSTGLADVPSSGAMIASYARSNALKKCQVPFFGDIPAADVPLLFAITRSHINFAITWRRHIETLHAMLAADTSLKWDFDADDPLGRLCALRREELVALRGEPGAHIALGVSNEQFFADSGASALAHERRFNHDKMHEFVAYEPNTPIYTRLRRDPDKALLSEALFRQLDITTQVRLVKEEAMVIALERYLLKGLVAPEEYQEAYWMALERISTTLARGWFREFACRHYPQCKVCDRNLASDAAHISADPSFLIAPPAAAVALSNLAMVTPTNRVLEAPDSIKPELVNAIADILASWRQVEQAVNARTVTTVVEFRVAKQGPTHRVKCVDSVDPAAFRNESSQNDGTASFAISLDDAVVLKGTVTRFTESHWDDSGCEWGGGGYYYSTKEIFSNVEIAELPAWFNAEVAALGVNLSPLLAFAATLGVPVRAYENRVVRLQWIRKALAMPPFIAVEKNAAHLFALQHPARHMIDSLRSARVVSSCNAAHLNLYSLPELLDEIKRCTHLKELTVVLPSTAAECSLLVDLTRHLPSLEFVTLQASKNHFIEPALWGVKHNLDQISDAPRSKNALPDENQVAAQIRAANANVKRVSVV